MHDGRIFRICPKWYTGSMMLAVFLSLCFIGLSSLIFKPGPGNTANAKAADTSYKLRLSKPPPAILAEFNRSRHPITRKKPAVAPVVIARDVPEAQPEPEAAPIKITFEGSNHS